MGSLNKVVFTGQLQPGFALADVVANLVAITNMDKTQAEAFLANTQPTLVKKDLDRQMAERYSARLAKAGIEVHIVGMEAAAPSNIPVAESNPAPPGPPDPPLQAPIAPKENLYASPQADLQIPKAAAQGHWLDAPQKVPASHGWQWIRAALGMFLAHPLKWMGMVLVLFLLQFILNLIPIVGFIIYGLVGLVFAGGLALAAENQVVGKPFGFSYLFKGFAGSCRNRLFMAGILYSGGFFLLMVLIGLLFSQTLGIGPFDMVKGGPGSEEAIASAMARNVHIFMIAILVGTALSIPLIMAVWFCVPIIAIMERKVWTAFRLSFWGCLKNWRAFLVYGLSFLALALVIMFGFIAIAGLTSFVAAGQGFSIIGFLPVLIALLLMFPFMVVSGLSIFTSFRDIFHRTTHAALGR